VNASAIRDLCFYIFYSISDLYHVSRSVWCAAAIMLYASCLTIVKTLTNSMKPRTSRSRKSPNIVVLCVFSSILEFDSRKHTDVSGATLQSYQHCVPSCRRCTTLDDVLTPGQMLKRRQNSLCYPLFFGAYMNLRFPVLSAQIAQEVHPRQRASRPTLPDDAHWRSPPALEWTCAAGKAI